MSTELTTPINIEIPGIGTIESADLYLKSEADKLIAEKDKEIAKLKDKCQMHDFFWEGCGFAKRGFKNSIAVREAFDDLEAELHHSNRKRCLAMAQWCMDAECKTEKDADFLVRWEYRWLALAEEPTWEKFLQLIRKEAK